MEEQTMRDRKHGKQGSCRKAKKGREMISSMKGGSEGLWEERRKEQR